MSYLQSCSGLSGTGPKGFGNQCEHYFLLIPHFIIHGSSLNNNHCLHRRPGWQHSASPPQTCIPILLLPASFTISNPQEPGPASRRETGCMGEQWPVPYRLCVDTHIACRNMSLRCDSNVAATGSHPPKFGKWDPGHISSFQVLVSEGGKRRGDHLREGRVGHDSVPAAWEHQKAGPDTLPLGCDWMQQCSAQWPGSMVSPTPGPPVSVSRLGGQVDIDKAWEVWKQADFPE